MKSIPSAALFVVLSLSAPTQAQHAFIFRDVGDEAGLFPHVARIAGHGVAWGDIDNSGWPSLYVGTFGGKPYDSKNNMLFRNVKGKFTLDTQPQLQLSGRGNGAVFVDLDNDGNLDLYYSNHAIDGKPYMMPHFSTPNALFRNTGGGKFVDVSKDSGCCPADFPARSVAALDFDGDGLVDLLVGECFFQGGQSRSRLFKNLGNFKFKDVTKEVGLPDKITGFGVAACDVNGDGWPDIFLAGRHHGNRLFINDGKGHFKEVPKQYADFTWQYKDTGDDTPCGVCFGDVNRDGLMDIVIGSHFDRPWYTGGVPVRLYLNRGVKDGWPTFEDVTEKVGLKPLPMKSPHVELQDFDNDGWPDLYVSIVKFAGGKAYPMIFKNHGVTIGGLPKFTEDVLGVNDFPTEADRKDGNVGPFFERMEKERKIVYMAPGPTCDFDRDGRIDMFLANWWVNSRSLLLRNETPSGNWLDVRVIGKNGVNRDGIGSLVRIYEAGKMGQKAALLGMREIAVGFGYASGQEASAHFGLGKVETCDLEVILPHGKGRIDRTGVKANQRLTIENK